MANRFRPLWSVLVAGCAAAIAVTPTATAAPTADGWRVPQSGGSSCSDSESSGGVPTVICEVHVEGGSVITGRLNGTLELFDKDIRSVDSSGKQPVPMAACSSTRHEFTLTH